MKNTKEFKKLQRELKETMLVKHNIEIDYRRNVSSYSHNEINEIAEECIKMVDNLNGGYTYNTQIEVQKMTEYNMTLSNATADYFVAIQIDVS